MLSYLKKKYNTLSSEILFLLYFHISILILFFIFRLMFMIYFYDELLPEDFLLYIKASFIGIRLDLIVSSYFSLPVLFTAYFPYIGYDSNKYKKIVSGYLVFVLLSLTLFSFINIEWFKEFGNHLNTMLMMYGTTQEAWGLIFEEYNLFLYFFLTVAITIFIFKVFSCLKNTISIKSLSNKIKFITFIISFIVTGVFIRGGLQNRPLDWGYAYFSQSNIANSIAQNPLFFFGRSYIEMKEEEEFKNKFLKINDLNKTESVYNQIRFNNSLDNNFPKIDRNSKNPPNIVLIILESFVSENCNFLNPNLDQNITPFLSELSNRSISFSNCYANGIRSAFGIGSILSSWPVIPGKPIISQVESGFSNSVVSQAMDVFLDLGYNRTFIYGGDSNFDNMKGFCIANGFNSIIDDKDRFFNSKFGTPFGVFDHIMVDTLIKVAKSKDSEVPFMITLFTTTNHTPFRIPEDYEQYFEHIKTGDKNYLRAKKTMAYNDLMLKNFFNEIKNQDWYKNTIFVITSDHGLSINRDFPIHPRNGHIPFMIFSELIDTSIKIDKIVSQIDIMPTIIDLIGEDRYLPNFYGISGLKDGPGFACRVSSNNLQWITPNNIYHEIMGQNKSFNLGFDSIWDLKYKKIEMIESSLIESNAYIRNAYHKFKHTNY